MQLMLEEPEDAELYHDEDGPLYQTWLDVFYVWPQKVSFFISQIL
jgi:hypothetical protein